jgi:hypothetical protein
MVGLLIVAPQIVTKAPPSKIEWNTRQIELPPPPDDP